MGLASRRSPGEYSMIDCLLGNAFGVLSCPFWSTVLQCGARQSIHTLNYWTVSGASFLTGGVFECALAHRRSVVVLCMLYRIKFNPTHPLYGALHEPYMQMRVTRSAVIAHRHTYERPRCGTSQYHRTFIPHVSISVK